MEERPFYFRHQDPSALPPPLFCSFHLQPNSHYVIIASLLTKGQTDGVRGGYSTTLGKYQNGETGRQTEPERGVGGKRAEERKTSLGKG